MRLFLFAFTFLFFVLPLGLDSRNPKYEGILTMAKELTFTQKLKKLSPALRKRIVLGERKYTPSPKTPISNWLVHTMRHCNGGRTVDAGLWLKKHCDEGGKIFLTMSGAGSSFQQGIMISELIRAGKIGGISVTGANLEESLYRALANEAYGNIPDYQELTRNQEQEFDDVGLRRITDTFLPEGETVRVILPLFEKMWRAAHRGKERRLWHEYFFDLFTWKMITPEQMTNPRDCWLYQAWLHKIPIFVPGYEDSTMGNIFTYYCFNGTHPFLKRYKQRKPINNDVVLPGTAYMHSLVQMYMNATRGGKKNWLAFLQLGGGIAADFPICVVPHLKKDYLAEESLQKQKRLIPPWAGFVEIFSSPMSYGSYSGAGGKEKITWSKLNPDAYMMQIQGDYTMHFPPIAALVLGE